MSTDPQSPDELDRHFRAYFQAELPKRWPGAPIPADAALPVARDSSGRSRLTLAASAVVLLGLGLYLTSSPRPAAGPSPVSKEQLLPGATADGGKVFIKATPTGKN